MNNLGYMINNGRNNWHQSDIVNNTEREEEEEKKRVMEDVYVL
jgi:hypothetical protein